MKSKRETTVIEIEDTDDDDFLSQVAQAESEALSASNIKRRKITTVGFNENQENTKTTTTTTIKVKGEYKNEGDYMAALKGSKSTLWQQRIKAVGSSKLPPPDYNARGGGGGGSGVVAPEKVCPCGLGVCNVFTANTERNRGRDFYKCPQRQESGGCGFFQWCDESPAENNGGGSHGSVSNSVFPELQCSCGAGSCLILTSRKGDNNGKQFYKCPENQGGCGFFKWCDDNTASAGLQSSAPKVCFNMNDSSNKSFGARTGSSCFKCGKEGHWAKDCGMSTSDSPATFGAGSGSSGTCYKCGKPGHWARDCTSSQYKNVPQQY
ncbi:PREDICTED: cold shock domain-containing protein 3 [Populus euphratica]|uniref:Cold shock domain-containing protein 3 n=1 Tax=Populus euphratica TaxID=75702 RepID=A0AAJ6VDU1_POPEU|nr:PREDICTED: cold shock domain-containing protein 3 [Populus euphratica]